MSPTKSKDPVLFICKKEFGWNWEGFEVVRKHFENVHLITWDGEEEVLDEIHAEIDSLSYAYLISFWSQYFILPNEFKAAKKGAINIHPAPTEHPGLGMISYIFAFPDKRMHHGTTVHEINEKLDNGPIYRSTVFPVYGMAPEEIVRCSIMDSLNMLDEICEVLKKGVPTNALQDKTKAWKWSPHFFTHKQEMEWLAKLPPYHIAHQAESFTIGTLVNSKYFTHCNDKFITYGKPPVFKNTKMKEMA